MLGKLFHRTPVHPSEQKLREFCRQRWPRKSRDQAKPIVLVSLYDVPVSVASVALGGNLLADAYDGHLASFCFEDRPDPRLVALYKDLGAPLVLKSGSSRSLVARSVRAASELLSHCGGSKEELIRAMYGDLLVGDLIYDSYLRHESRPTVDFADPALEKVTAKVFEALFLCEEFFSKNRVAAVIPDHVVYLRGGAISRFAASRGIPVLLPGFRKKFSFRPAAWIDAGEGRQALYNFDFENFSSFFASLTPAAQARGREMARQHLDMILSGSSSPVEGMQSPYAAPSRERVLPDTGRPRILVMLHEFCDAPHCLGHMLYPDFLEWIHDTLEQARQTGFDWFVKPHACLLMKGRRGINQTNREVVEDLKRKFPQVTFLEPDISNRQILQDGLTSMFTLHGSAGYEFAYQGVPVVTAGNTHYRKFGITENPGTLAEYRDWIHRADQVPLRVDKTRIEEFYFCLLAHTRMGLGEGAPLFPPGMFEPGFDTSLLARQELYDGVLDFFDHEVQENLLNSFREFAAAHPVNR